MRLSCDSEKFRRYQLEKIDKNGQPSRQQGNSFGAFVVVGASVSVLCRAAIHSHVMQGGWLDMAGGGQEMCKFIMIFYHKLIQSLVEIP